MKGDDKNKEPKVNLKNTLYVANLFRTINEEDLKKTFSKFGNILSVFIPKNDGNSKGYGYVEYDNEKSVQDAKSFVTSNSLEFPGHPGKKLRCDVYMSRKDRSEHRRKNYVNVYIKNLYEEIDDDLLKNIFACFGNITKPKVAREDGGKSKKFGYIKFGTHDDAKKLVDATRQILLLKNLENDTNPDKLKNDFINFGKIDNTFVYKNYGLVIFKNNAATINARDSLRGKTTSGKIIVTCMFKKRGERKYAVNKINREIRFNRFAKYFGRNYQIRGIDEKLTEKALHSKFKKHMGQDCRITFMKENGKNTGLGYVTFQSMDDAVTITEKFHDNKKMINGKNAIIFITPIIKEVKSKKIDVDLHQLYDENYEGYLIDNGIPIDDPQFSEQFDQFGDQYGDQFGNQYGNQYGSQFNNNNNQFGNTQFTYNPNPNPNPNPVQFQFNLKGNFNPFANNNNQK